MPDGKNNPYGKGKNLVNTCHHQVAITLSPKSVWCIGLTKFQMASLSLWKVQDIYSIENTFVIQWFHFIIMTSCSLTHDKRHFFSICHLTDIGWFLIYQFIHAEIITWEMVTVLGRTVTNQLPRYCASFTIDHTLFHWWLKWVKATGYSLHLITKPNVQNRWVYSETCLNQVTRVSRKQKSGFIAVLCYYRGV